MPVVQNISEYQPSFNENLFFDNNVWVYLFCPFANFQKAKQRDYSVFLKSAQQKKCAIYINSIILSEFCNYWLQTEFKNWLKKNPGKTDYKKDWLYSKISMKYVIFAEIIGYADTGKDKNII